MDSSCSNDLAWIIEKKDGTEKQGTCDVSSDQTSTGPSPANNCQDDEIAKQMLLLQNVDGLDQVQGDKGNQLLDPESDDEVTDEELANQSSGESVEQGEIESEDESDSEDVVSSISIFEYQEDNKLVQKGQFELQDLAENKEKCGICDMQFASHKDLQSHMKIHTDEKRKYPCRYCSKQFPFQGLYHQHLNKKHYNKKHFICSLCGKRFANKWYLTQHERFHRGRYKCLECDKYFVTKHTLENHMTQHSGDAPRKRGRPRKVATEVLESGLVVYKCHVCKKTFNTISLLSRHKRSHRNQSFSCEVCHREFSMFSYLKKHLEIHDENRTTTCMCQYCGKTFMEPWYCRRHESTHAESKETPALQCRYCHIAFTTSSNYKRHLRKHTGEKPFVCAFCGKGFAENGTLTRHARTHTGEKPYGCKTCDKRFTVAHALKRHEKIHSAPRTFLCRFCSKAFSDKALLDRHAKGHEQQVEILADPKGGLQIVEQDIHDGSVHLSESDKPDGMQVHLETGETSGGDGDAIMNSALMSGQILQQVQLQDGRSVYATVFEKGTLGNWQVHVQGKDTEGK